MAPKRPHSEPLPDQEIQTQPKRRRTSPQDTDSLIPLTKENLRLLDEMTGSRQTPNGPKTAYTSSKDETATKAKTTSTTKFGFEEKMRANGILHAVEGVRHPPANKLELQTVLDKSRASTSPTASQHDNYLEQYLDTANEADTLRLLEHTVLKSVTPQLRKDGYADHVDKQWVDFPKDVGFNNNLSAPKPDYIEGFRRDTFPPTVQQLGGAATLVKDTPRFPALPHLAMELKATGENMHLAECQAAYDGAAMVYARNKALDFLGEKDEHGNATVLSATTDGKKYDIFGHYTLIDEKTETTRFYQRCLAQGSLEDFDDFKTGFRRFRNMQDWARDKSFDIRERMTKDHESKQFGRSRPSQSVGSKKSARPSAPSNPSDQMPSRSSSDSSEYRDRYRDRRSYRDPDIPSLQHRRSDSPHDKLRAQRVKGRDPARPPAAARPAAASSDHSYASRSSAQRPTGNDVPSPVPTASKVSDQDGVQGPIGVKQMRKDVPPASKARPVPTGSRGSDWSRFVTIRVKHYASNGSRGASGSNILRAGGVALKKYNLGAPLGKLKLKPRQPASE